MAHRILILLGLAACHPEFGEYGSGASDASGDPVVDRDGEGGASAAGGPSVGGAAGGPSSGGSSSAGEDCTNGLDDDDNGLSDCADPVCGGYVCVPAPPAFEGWRGPLDLHNAEQAECYAGWQAETTEGELLLAAPDPCGCVCAPPANAVCSATLSFAAGDCNAAALTVEVPANGCFAFGGNAQSASAQAKPKGGSCASSEAPVVAPSFEPRLLCAAPKAGGCASDEACVRPPGPAVSEATCFAKDGNHECPAAPYLKRKQLYRSPPQDERTCEGSCSCSSPSGGSCDGTVGLFSSSCAGPAALEIELPSACSAQPFTNFAFVGYSDASVVSPASCAPTTRTTVGEITGDVVTLCCSEE